MNWNYLRNIWISETEEKNFICAIRAELNLCEGKISRTKKCLDFLLTLLATPDAKNVRRKKIITVEYYFSRISEEISERTKNLRAKKYEENISSRMIIVL